MHYVQSTTLNIQSTMRHMQSIMQYAWLANHVSHGTHSGPKKQAIPLVVLAFETQNMISIKAEFEQKQLLLLFLLCATFY